MENGVHEFTLSNGIRVVHKEVNNTRVAHCGFVVELGSRDENEGEEGISHFWEHMVFKGTRKRRMFHVLDRLESLGGEMNAYTTKEKISFFASILDRHYDKAVELLKDITFNSVFPEKEIERERNVILEEMAMYYDTPEESMHDDFESLIFKGHPLEHNILGTKDSVRSIQKQQLQDFLNRSLDNNRLVFASVGNIPPKKAERVIRKYLEDVPFRTSERTRQPFTNYVPESLEMKRPDYQAHCMIGRAAYPVKDDRRIPMVLLNNLLGGPGMNARLNLSMREKKGYVYTVESGYSPFSDTGVWGVYFGTDPGYLDKSIRLIFKELKWLREKPLGTMQLHKAKEQLIGQLAMAEENNATLMQVMAKSLLDFNRVENLSDVFDRINRITSAELQDIANEMFREEDLSILKYIPENGYNES